MEITLHPLSRIDTAGLAQLARLHRENLPSLLSELGTAFLEKYYRAASKDSQTIGYYAQLAPLDEPVGWIIGTPQPGKLNDSLRRPFRWFAAQLLGFLVTRPQTLAQLLFSAASSSRKAPAESEMIELVYLGVAPQARHQGIGKALLEHFIQDSRAAGYPAVVLSVETENKTAFELYRKTGFHIHRRIREGRFERYRMLMLL